jgi:hypothetical protein
MLYEVEYFESVEKQLKRENKTKNVLELQNTKRIKITEHTHNVK